MIAPAPTTYPAALARTVGESLMELLRPYCEPGRLMLAGSLRRQPTPDPSKGGEQGEVGDVEICYVSKTGPAVKPGEMFESSTLLADLFIQSLLWGKLRQRASEDGKFTWGQWNKFAVHKATGLPVDLFRDTDANWWRTVVMRTGPMEFDLKLIAGAKRNALKLHVYGPAFTTLDSDGKDTGEVRPCGSEEEFLAMCGYDWLAPEERQQFKT